MRDLYTPQAYNFKTGKHEPVDMTELSAEQLREYMPQDATVQGIYTAYLGLGESPVKAYLKTMEAVAASYRKGGE